LLGDAASLTLAFPASMRLVSSGRMKTRTRRVCGGNSLVSFGCWLRRLRWRGRRHTSHGLVALISTTFFRHFNTLLQFGVAIRDWLGGGCSWLGRGRL